MDCCHKTKVRDAEAKRKLTHRLSRIEGQIRGIRNMVESDAYCPDILLQVAAAAAALEAFKGELLADHIRTCVLHDVKAGNEETVEELIETLRRIR